MTTPNADANGTGTNGNGAPPAGGAPGGSGGDQGGVEDIRNWDDVKKAFTTRDALKGEVKELRTLVEGIGQKLEQLVKPAAGQPQGQPAPAPGAPPQGQQAAPPQGGEAPKPGSIEETVANLAKIVTGLATDKSDVLKAQRRKTVEDTVAAAAKPEARELVRGALAMLALDGHVDLHAEDSAAQVEKALTKLRAGNPGHFAAANGSAPAPNGQQNPIPPGAEAHELTPEQLARLSDEDFTKLRKQSRTSGLAV
jgi:hypothetical protein